MGNRGDSFGELDTYRSTRPRAPVHREGRASRPCSTCAALTPMDGRSDPRRTCWETK
jgi:hypothetical protein